MILTVLLAATLASGDAPPEAPKPEKAKKERICKTQGKTGSRLGGKKVCMSKAEWAQSEAEHQQEADRIVGRTGSATPGL